MKFRIIPIIILAGILLSACNFTLAQDITPPPGSVQQARPTQGPLFPAQPPSIENGAVIYAEKCAACHGDTGLGDGDQGKQLPVPVAALGLPEVASKASPAKWYLTVTLGNIDRFMPPFNSLNEQERWDVVAYAFTLSTMPEQVEQGQALFAANCAQCHNEMPEFVTQARMSELSAENLDFSIVNGVGEMKGFGDALSAEERQAINIYLRSLTFDASPLPVAATVAPDGTPVEGTEQAEVPTEAPADAEPGSVRGKIVNGSGGVVPSGLTVTLRGYEHGDTSSGAAPEEILTLTTSVASDGSYSFSDVELLDGQFLIVETDYDGITFQSELAVAETDATEVAIPDLTLYEKTSETGGLVVEEMFIFSEFNADGTLRLFAQYYITNKSNRAVAIDTDGTSMSILPAPAGVQGVSFQLTQDSAPLMPTETGFALLPGEQPYGIIAFFGVPYDRKLELIQPFALPVTSISVIVPEGIKVTSDQLTDQGVREMQPGSAFQVYSGGSLNAGDSLEMSISGRVKSASSTGSLDNRQLLLIGAGVLGLSLIAAGGWMFWRDRKLADDEYEENDFIEEEDDEFESAEEVMDAILVLDDLHRSKQISDEIYHKRREELKNRLKELA